MKIVPRATAVSALLLVAGCNVQVDRNLQSEMENQADAFERDLQNVGAAASNAIDRAGDSIENQAGAIDNGIDVDIGIGKAGEEAETSNRQ